MIGTCCRKTQIEMGGGTLFVHNHASYHVGLQNNRIFFAWGIQFFFSVKVTCSCHPTWLPLLLVEWFLLFFLFVLKSISIVPCSVPVRVKAAPTLLHQQYVPLHLSTFLIVRGVTACLLDLLISVWWLSSTDLNSWKNLCDSWRTLRERNLCRLLSKKLYHLLRYWRYVVPVHQQC